MSADLRLGRWQDALADVGMVDAVITDPPYSARTHEGHFAGSEAPDLTDDEKVSRADWLERKGYDDKRGLRRSLDYASWGDDDVSAFVASWAPRCRGWFVVMYDHILARAWERELAAVGLYVFAPLPFVEPGKCPRLTGDGPASWVCWITVARPKSTSHSRWGSLPGCYITPKGLESRRMVVGGKPESLMRALVRDYTKPGDLVCDPCAGGATTLLAAVTEGRRAVGSEMDPETYAKAKARLARGYTPDMFAGLGA